MRWSKNSDYDVHSVQLMENIHKREQNEYNDVMGIRCCFLF